MDLLAIESKRDGFIRDYSLLQNTLTDLDLLDLKVWPTMEVRDTFQESSEQHRTLGYSQAEEGILWYMGVPELKQRITEENEEVLGSNGNNEVACDIEFNPGQATRGPVKKRKKDPQQKAKSSKKQDKDDEHSVTTDGWIWHARGMGKMTEEQIKHWPGTCDRVQWMRSEAGFEQWQEQLKQKHAKFMRCIAFFANMQDTWQTLASDKRLSTPGHWAYVKEHSDMYKTLRLSCEIKYKACAILILHNIPSGKTLVVHSNVQAQA
ncbi:hypothetical protein PQX77_019714 [Marasmius sp. AFHP31]|nr:hypothetical protein PQX77_019714 [Marasmius sp. AFHP31]